MGQIGINPEGLYEIQMGFPKFEDENPAAVFYGLEVLPLVGRNEDLLTCVGIHICYRH